MVIGWDFLEWLGCDMSIKIFMCLDDPVDLVRATAVSRRWRSFVIENAFCKNLVLKLHPEASTFAQVIEVKSLFEPIEVVPDNFSDWEHLETEHRAFALLGQHLNSPMASRDCALQSISASSTDNYPDEGIENTLEPNNRLSIRPSYWSSKGAKDPRMPETLTYRLNSNLSIIDQINLKPFLAYFQYGHPIYSAQAIRFRMGYSISLQEMSISDKPVISDQSSGDDFIWTYVSPTYPMVQENVLQFFKLPRPVICIGGILQIEFLGQVQKQEMDGLYYICMCYVQVLGRPSPPAFDIGHFDNSWRLALKHFLHAQNCMSREQSENEQVGTSGVHDVDVRVTSGWHAFAERLGLRTAAGWNGMLLGHLLGGGNADDDSDEEDPLP